MSYNRGNRRREPDVGGSLARILPVIVGGVIFLFIMGMMANACSSRFGSFGSSITSWTDSGTSASRGQVETARNSVPWDYKLAEGTVGDLIGGDMTILPDNQLLPNDNNYATGDKVWTLQYMSAEMDAGPDGRSNVTLSAWKTIKSYKTQDEADKDVANLKVSLKTKIDLVGVYKTEYNGQTRQFAVLTLPSGQQIKQPVDEKRYAALKPLKQADVLLEEVHDYQNYDMAYAKFRGWAS